MSNGYFEKGHIRNKDTKLGQGTSNEVSAIDVKDAVDKRHSNILDHLHLNKTLLDGYDQTNTDISDAILNKHSNALDHSNSLDHAHLNKSLLDTYSQSEADLADSISKKHSNSLDHSNFLDHDGSIQDTAVAGKTTLTEVKADTDIADAISKKHSNILDHSNSLDHSHLNKSVLDDYAQTEVNLADAVSKKHSNTLDHNNSLDHSNANDPTADQKLALAGTAGTPSGTNKFVTDSDSRNTNARTPSAHSEYALRLVSASQSTTTDSQTMYWGGMAVAPSTTAARWRVYIPFTGTIKAAYIYSYSGTAGSNESWKMYIRVNNTTDYLIQDLTLSATDRVWSNTSLSISVNQGDYIEIKEVQPAWGTNPATVTRNGVIYISTI
jgi:hypothetical protein